MATDARRSALGAHAGRMADASGDDVRLRGVPGLAQTGLRVAPEGEAAAARRRRAGRGAAGRAVHGRDASASGACSGSAPTSGS